MSSLQIVLHLQTCVHPVQMKTKIESAERARAQIVIMHRGQSSTMVTSAILTDPVCIRSSDKCKGASALHKYLSRDWWRGGGFAIVDEVCILGLICQLLLCGRHCWVQSRHAGYAAPRRQRRRCIKEGVTGLLRLLRLVPAQMSTPSLRICHR